MPISAGLKAKWKSMKPILGRPFRTGAGPTASSYVRPARLNGGEEQRASTTRVWHLSTPRRSRLCGDGSGGGQIHLARYNQRQSIHRNNDLFRHLEILQWLEGRLRRPPNGQSRGS